MSGPSEVIPGAGTERRGRSPGQGVRGAIVLRSANDDTMVIILLDSWGQARAGSYPSFPTIVPLHLHKKNNKSTFLTTNYIFTSSSQEHTSSSVRAYNLPTLSLARPGLHWPLMDWRSMLKAKTCPLPSFDLSHAIELSQVHNNATLICRDSFFCTLIRRLYLHEPYKFGQDVSILLPRLTRIFVT